MNRLLIIIFSLVTFFISSFFTTEILKGEPASISQQVPAYDTTRIGLPFKITPVKLNILPPSSGIQFYKDGIVYPDQTKDDSKMTTKHLSFGTIQAHYAIISDSGLVQPKVFSPSYPFSYPCEAITFSKDFNVMYFSGILKSVKKEKIYRAEYTSATKTGWLIDEEPAAFCTDDAVYSHPALSADGTFMVFVSNKSGSYGGMDLFLTRRKADSWSEPENIGIAINTASNEFFPFLDTENNLFFSSNGHSGFGGYDLFVSRFNGNGWDIPLNLTKHINSRDDDFAFRINNLDKKTSFFTSREGSPGDSIKLYALTLSEKLKSINDMTLFKVLYPLAVSEIDSIEVKKIMARLEAEKMDAKSRENARIEAEKANAARMRNDSLEALRLKAARVESEKNNAARLEAERLALAKRESDRLEAERIRAARMKADSTEAARIEAARIEAEKNRIARMKADSIEKEKSKSTKDIILYRIQFYSSIKFEEIKEITVESVKYKVHQYIYLGNYRYTIGEFNSLEPAVELQNKMRRSGYPHAFVAAFKNNVRSTDPALFK